MPSTENRFTTEDRHDLIGIARDSIHYGLQHGTPLPPRLEDYTGLLVEPGAAFVTLHHGAALRGCIGSLEPWRPLVQDVAENAFAAAFRDPRFPPLSPGEWQGLHIHISVLSPAEPLQFSDEQDLLAQLRPGVDGLILEDQGRRGTFLPTVWESLPEPADFFRQLKHKAGLSPNHWSDALRVSRYTTESFSG